MKKIKLFALIILFILPPAASAQSPSGARVVILTDASGSMAGFFATQSIHKLHDEIVKAAGGNRIVGDYYFVYHKKKDASELVNYDRGFYDWGSDTFLDRAFDDVRRKAPEFDVMFMVTDNIQDSQAGETAVKSIENFYHKFRRADVVAAHFFPKVLPFRGPLYERDGRTRIGARHGQPDYVYSGDRALVIYAFLMKEGIDLQPILNEFAKWVGQTAIASKINPGAIQIIEANAPIEGKQVLILKDGKLVPDLSKGRPSVFSAGEPIIARFRLQFQSSPQNLKIVRRVPVKFELNDQFKFFEFGKAATDFHAEDPQTIPEPEWLDGELYPPGDPRNDPTKNVVTFRIQFDNGVRFSASLGALVNYMFKSQAGDFKGSVRVRLPVERGQYKLVDEIERDYTTEDGAYFGFPPDPGLQKKVFGLAKVFNQTYDEVTYPFDKTYPIVFQVNYPRWPLFALLFLLLMFGGLVFLWLRFQPEYVLSASGPSSYSFKRFQKESPLTAQDYDDNYGDNRGYRYEQPAGGSGGEEEIFRLFPFFASHPVHLNESIAAKLRRFPLAGVYAFANSGFRVEEKKVHRLDDIGTNFDISIAAPKAPAAGPAAPDRDDENRSDEGFSSYNYGGYSGSSSNAGSSSSGEESRPAPKKKPRKGSDGGGSSSNYGSGMDDV